MTPPPNLSAADRDALTAVLLSNHAQLAAMQQQVTALQHSTDAALRLLAGDVEEEEQPPKKPRPRFLGDGDPPAPGSGR